MEQNNNTIVNNINLLLQNEKIRMKLFLVSSVFMGYTLNPVPQFLDKNFNESLLFKFFILVTSGIILEYPLTNKNFLNIVIISAVTLFVFSYIRTWKI
jgi:hypothetical protein